MSDNFVDFHTVKQRVSMIMVLDHYGVKLHQSNRIALRGHCPLPAHTSERSNESFSVQLEKNIWACQSASCAAARGGKRGGNILDFVATMESCTVREAAVRLFDWFLKTPSPPRSPAEGKGSSGATETLVSEKNTAAVDEVVNKPLSFTLKDIDPCHPYINSRGITEDVARHFGIGFFPGRGLMNGRVVIPIHDQHGQLIAYAGRAIDGAEPKYKVPAGLVKSVVLFNYHRARTVGKESVVVVEGFFDCIRVHQAGYPNVVALMGSSYSDAHESLLSVFNRVVVFLDANEAGRTGSAAMAAKLVHHTFVRVINLPDGKEPDQLPADDIQTILGPIV